MLGELEQLVLMAVLRGGGVSYGVSVRREIETRGGRTLTLGTVHKTLGRLEDKGFVESYQGEPTPVRGGRRKRHYTLTAAGHAALREALDTTRRMARGLRLGWENR
ncbi:MAG TPA: helix-turn-helix transcriptional regulator [Gemmatimonadaceae bacterium]|nr:helix-turn-helix transcriptional regulator [Gemmatimonadaceae bacterium]